MNRAWLTALVSMVTVCATLAQTASGLLLDDPDYLGAPFEEVLTKEFLPSRVSYEAYCPSVGAQGAYSTCVGFACGYYLRTILEAKTQRITRKTAIDGLAFSPGYLYEKAKADADYACTQGVYLSRAFTVLKETGVAPFRTFPYPACSQKTAPVDALAARFRIMAYERLFGLRDEPPQKTYRLRKALADGSPVVVGIVAPASFYSAKKTWNPAPTDNPADARLTGHALCVIGYDDTRYGGAFRVVNSFGKAWGDGGFCWIRYRDLARFTRYGYRISLPADGKIVSGK